MTKTACFLCVSTVMLLWGCTETEPRTRRDTVPSSDDSDTSPGETDSLHDPDDTQPGSTDTTPVTSPECENEGERYCDFTCMLPNTDNHCGACNTRCSAGSVCLEVGELRWDCGCAPGSIRCNGKCTDPKTDIQYCGASGTCTDTEIGENCGIGGACVKGRCECAATHTECGGKCVDTLTDRDYCGSSPDECGVSCMNGGICVAGSCACPATLPNECDIGCVDTLNDSRACGGCVESGGQQCDTDNGFTCIAGACDCATGRTLCDGQCVDINFDRENCGGCYDSGAGPGVRCGSSQSCFNATCVSSACDPAVMGTRCDGLIPRLKDACFTTDDHFTAAGIKCDNNPSGIPTNTAVCYEIRDVPTFGEFRCWWSGRNLTVNGNPMACSNAGNSYLSLPPSVGGSYCVYFPPSSTGGAESDGFAMGNR